MRYFELEIFYWLILLQNCLKLAKMRASTIVARILADISRNENMQFWLEFWLKLAGMRTNRILARILAVISRNKYKYNSGYNFGYNFQLGMQLARS